MTERRGDRSRAAYSQHRYVVASNSTNVGYDDGDDDDMADGAPVLQLHMSSSSLHCDSSCELDVAYDNDDNNNNDEEEEEAGVAHGLAHSHRHAHDVQATVSYTPPPPPACASCKAHNSSNNKDNNSSSSVARNGCAACHAAMARLCATLVYGHTGADDDDNDNDNNDSNASADATSAATPTQLTLPLRFDSDAASTLPLFTTTTSPATHNSVTRTATAATTTTAAAAAARAEHVPSPLQTMLHDMASHRLWWVRYLLVPLLQRWHRERTSALLTAVTASQHVERTNAHAHVATSASAAAAVTLLSSSYARVLQHTRALDAMLDAVARIFAAAILREQHAQQQQQQIDKKRVSSSSWQLPLRLPARWQCAAEVMYMYGSMACASQSYMLLCRGAKLLLRLHLSWLAHDVRVAHTKMATATSANTHSSSATAVCTACRGATLRARRHARALLRCWCVYMARYGAALYDTHSNSNNNTGVDIAAGMHEGRWLFLMLLITQTRSQLSSNTFFSSSTTTRRAAAAAADETTMSPSTSQQQQQQLLLQAHVQHILVYFAARVTTELLSLAHDQLSGVAAACKDDDNNNSSISRHRRRVTRVCTLPQLSSVRNVLTCRSLYWAAVADQQSTHDMHTRADVSSNNSGGSNSNTTASSSLLTAHQTAQLRAAARDYWQAVLPAYQMLTYVQSPCSLHEAAAWTSVDGNVATMYSSHRSRSATLAMGEGSDDDDDDDDDDDEQAAAMLAALRGADDDDVVMRTLPTALYTRTLQCAAAYTRHCCARSRWRVDAPALQLHRQLSLLRGDVLPPHVVNANNNSNANNTDAKNDSGCARARLFVYLHTHFLPVYDARCFWLLQQPERQHNLSRALRSLHDALHVHVATYAQRVVGVLKSTSTRATAAAATAVTDATTTTTTMSDADTAAAAAAATAAATDDKDKSDSDAWESDEDVAKATELHTADTLPSVLSPPPALAAATTTMNTTTRATVSSSSSSDDEHKADEANDTSCLLQQWRHRRLARTCALLLRDEYVMMSLTHSILVLLERRATIHRNDAAVLCAHALPTVSCLAGYALYLAQRHGVCNSNNNNNNNNSGGDDNNDDNVYDGSDCADDVVTARVCTCRAHYSLCALIHAGVLTLPWSLAALYAALVRHYRLCAAFDVNDSHASAATATTTTAAAAQPSLRSVDELCAATAQLEADIANNNNSSSSSTAIDAFHALLVAGEVPTTTLLDQALRRVTAIALPPPLSLLLIVAAHRVCARQFVALRVAFDDARARAADDDDGGGGGGRSGYDMHSMRSSSSRGGGDVVGSSGGGSGSLFARSGASSSGGGGSASMRCGDGAFCTSQDVVLLRVVMTTVHRLVFAYTTTTTAQGQSHDNNSSSSSANDTTSSLPPALHDLLRLWMAYVYDLLVVVVPHTDRDERETVVRLPSSWQETHTCVSVFGVTCHCRGWRALRAAPVCASQTDVRVAVATALAELALLPLMDTAAAKSSACALPSVASPSPTTTTTAMTSMRSCAIVQDALPCAVLQQLCLLLHVDVVLDESKATTTATTTTTVRQEHNNNDDDSDDDRDKDVHITDAHARACIAAAAARVSHSFIGLHGLLALCRRLEQCIVPGSVAAHTRLAALLRTLFALVDAAARSV